MRALWYTVLIQAMKERVIALPFCRELSVGARQQRQATKYTPEPYTESLCRRLYRVRPLKRVGFIRTLRGISREVYANMRW